MWILYAMIVIAVFVAAAATMVAIWLGLEEAGFNRFGRRIRQVRRQSLPGESLAPLGDSLGLLQEATVAPRSPVVVRERAVALNTLLKQARVRLSAGRFLTLSTAVGGCALAAGIGAGLPLLLLPVCAGLAAAAPAAWVLARRQRRVRQVEEQIPEALATMANALRSMQSLNVALQSARDGSRPPLSESLQELCESLRLGVPLEESLRGLTRSVPSRELQFIAAAINMQHTTGGNLARVLDMTSNIVRERFELLRQVKALSAEGRLSGWVLVLLPLLAFAATYRLAPDYVMVLFQDELGKKLLAATVLLQLVGMVAIKRIVSQVG